MSLHAKLQRLCETRDLKFKVDERDNLFVPMSLGDDDDKVVLVMSVDEDEGRVTYLSAKVLNTKDYIGLIDAEDIYHILLRFNWNVKIGALQLDTDGEVRFEYVQLTTEQSLTDEQFDFIFRTLIGSTLLIRREINELAKDDVVPEALQSVYRSHKLTLQSDEVDTIQLTAIKAVFEGFLAAGFPEPFNAVLQRDLGIIAAKLDELAPTEF